MWKPSKFFTEAEVAAAMTPRGGFSRESMRKLGVPWPPPQGWRSAITMRPKRAASALPGEDKPPRERTPEDWYRLIPRLAHWAFKA